MVGGQGPRDLEGWLVLLPPGKKKTAVKDKLQIAMCCVSVESGVRGKS